MNALFPVPGASCDCPPTGHRCRPSFVAVEDWPKPCLLCGSMTPHHVCPVRPGGKP